MVKIQEMLLTPDKWARPQTKLKGVDAVVWHWVANPNSSAKGNRNFFENRTGSYGSAHYIIGLDGEVIRALPENEMGYHVGSHVYTSRALKELGSYPNNNTIGIECTHIDWDGKMNKKTYNALIELTADILKRHGLTADDIWLHQEVVGWKDCHRWFVNNQDEYKKAKETVAKKLGQSIVKVPQRPTLDDLELVEADAHGMYQIQKGDTLWGISRALDTTVEELKKLNPKVNPNALRVGSKIKVSESSVKEHTIAKGDTLWELARKYNTTVAKLQQLNKGVEAKALQVGGKILVPSDGKLEPIKEAPKPAPKPKPEVKPVPAKKPAKKPDMKTNSIVTYLNSIGEKSDFGSRKKLAESKGIKGYSGTEKQNLQLLDMLRNPKPASKPASTGHKHNFKKVVRVKGDVWLHSKANFNSSSRTKVAKTGTILDVCCESNGMYYSDKGWVSKKYVEVFTENKDIYDLPSVTLKRGSKGSNVAKVQRALNKLYFKVGKEDGSYGAKTEDAVKRFQMVHDAYKVTGIYNSRVEKKMEALLKKQK